MTKSNPDDLIDLISREIKARELARKNFLAFIKYVWWKSGQFIEGKHNRECAKLLDTCVSRFLNGQSSYLDIAWPFRHGKSDFFSVAFPAYFIGRLCEKGIDPDVILTGYGASLIEGFSLQCLELVKSKKYRNLFPMVELSSRKQTAADWRLKYNSGRVVATGLEGALTGKGGMLGVCDDTVKTRKEAESQTYRDATWNAFTNNFLTRMAPVHIVILVQTPWHVDDVQGRIARKMEDEGTGGFPNFQRIRYPARKKKEDGSYEYLFPERFPSSWYEMQYGQLSGYDASGLLDCDPQPAQGNVAQPEWFRPLDFVPNIVERVRCWDFAASVSNHSDYTSGVLMGRTKEGSFVILDIFRERLEAGQVMDTVERVAELDGNSVAIGLEREPGSSGKILFDQFARRLSRFIVKEIRPSSDKLTRALPLFSAAKNNLVYVAPNKHHEVFSQEIRLFPAGEHDDMVDATAHSYNLLSETKKISIF